MESSDTTLVRRRHVAAMLAAADATLLRTRHDADEAICSEDAPPGCCYRVESGAVRCCTYASSGRRRVIDFLIPGDLFRTADTVGPRMRFEAIVTPTVVARLARMTSAEDGTEVPAAREVLPQAIARLQANALSPGHATTAVERVAAFLLEFTRRSGADPGSPVVLPMSRYDIADHLGLAVESVSRALTRLRRDGIIDLSGPKRVRIAMPPRLRQLGTRWQDA